MLSPRSQSDFLQKHQGVRAQVRIQKIGNICNNARSTIMQARSIIMLITGTYITDAKSSRAARSKRSTVATARVTLHSFKKYCLRIGENKIENEMRDNTRSECGIFR